MSKKKIFIMLMLLSLVLFSSCSSLKNAVIARTPDFDGPMTYEFTLVLDDDTTLVGNMSRLGMGFWEMNITSPDTLAGLHISYNDTEVNASMGELKLNIAREKLNDAAVFRLIFDAIDNCAAQTQISLSESEDGSLIYNGTLPQCGYILAFDSETMLLNGITFPDLNISASLTPQPNEVYETTSAVTE